MLRLIRVLRCKSLSWAAICLALLAAPRVEAQEVELEQTALALAPADAAFFGTSINLLQAWQEFLNGKFVTRLRAVPFIQEVEEEFNQQWANPEGPLAQAKAGLANPNIQNLVKLLVDMGSQEVFIYGGDDWCEMIEGALEFQNRMTSAMGEGPEELEQFLKNLTREDIDAIHIPTTVLGFRLTDAESARMQLDALEGLLRIAGGQAEELQPLLERLRRTDLREGQTLSLRLDTSLIPLDSLDEEQREVAEKVIELLEDRSVTIGMGVKSQLLLIAFSEDPQAIENVGEASSKLLEHESMEVLKAAEITNLRGISYVSQRWRESQWNANFQHYFQRLAVQLTAAAKQESGEAADVQQWETELQADAAWLDQQIARVAPEFGAQLAWSRKTQTGSEGWSYDWSKNVGLRNAQPLKVLNHAGTGSLLLLGWKQADMPVVGEIIERVIEKAPAHVRRFIAMAEEDEQERERALQVFDKTWPLVAEGYAVLRDSILPALDDNETLVAMAARWSTPTLGENLPPPRQPLPLPEWAVACSLSDREQFIEGCQELYEVFDRAVEVMRELNPDRVPDGYEVPRPEQEEVAGATRYHYEEWSSSVALDGFVPQLLVTDDLLLVGYSDRQLKDMLTARPLATRPAWLEATMPVAAVSYVDVAGMITAGRPWIAYGLTVARPSLDDPMWQGAGPIPTGNDILQIWDCFSSIGRSAATATVSEDGPLVSRWVWVRQ